MDKDVGKAYQSSERTLSMGGHHIRSPIAQYRFGLRNAGWAVEVGDEADALRYVCARRLERYGVICERTASGLSRGCGRDPFQQCFAADWISLDVRPTDSASTAVME
jgi:hypothetical protein